MKRHGFSAMPYLDTLDTGWIHVDTRNTTIAREVYRRVHTGEMKRRDKKPLSECPRAEVRSMCKEMIRYLLGRHQDNRDLYRDVMRTPNFSE